ncbi:hemerythrin domain-containing protein [Paracandidimonas soli]|uniref:Regulator of cell morphogenesis and NO signaling n=1 Tax=Paracandidimonas soli TaxID=1917182 RepID=A0A4R3VAZ9_9BURK|nr:hemerythrin domain-containing protein [Paracandidimonas soli]TCV00774.1 regulator of cell morphogenesis and NO signaling [Paracandidimonas soli]
MTLIQPETGPGALDDQAGGEQRVDYTRLPVADLIRHILARYHERHRVQLPELIYLARKVERAHAGHPDCPAGLADSLEDIQQSLESHMMKEEQVLFPLLMRGAFAQAQGPISVMRFEHEQHGEALADVQDITRNLHVPSDACGTWSTLYAGLTEFRNDLMQHIQLENDVLFSKATNAVEGAHYG